MCQEILKPAEGTAGGLGKYLSLLTISKQSENHEQNYRNCRQSQYGFRGADGQTSREGRNHRRLGIPDVARRQGSQSGLRNGPAGRTGENDWPRWRGYFWRTAETQF